jgi:NADP-dependent 3-hydroxy acid dehydrogenase YdfG
LIGKIFEDKELLEIEKDGKKLDLVVENAGISMRCEFKDYNFDNHVSILNVNVNGPYKHIQGIV